MVKWDGAGRLANSLFLLCLGLRSFPGHSILITKTGMVPAKPGQVVTLAAKHIHCKSFPPVFCLRQNKPMIVKALCPQARQAPGKDTGLIFRDVVSRPGDTSYGLTSAYFPNLSEFWFPCLENENYITLGFSIKMKLEGAHDL